jgi:tetratricopeptide (TPR) repeat protein
MKFLTLASCALAAALVAAAPAHAQYTGGGNTALPTTETIDPTLLYKQAVEFIQKKDYMRAIPLLRDVLEKREQDPASNLMMGVAQIGLGDLKEAHRYLTRAVSEKPDLTDAIGRLGWVEAKLGNADAAAKQRSILVGLKDKCKGSCPEAASIDSAIAVIDNAAKQPAVSAATRFNQGIDFIGAKNWNEAVAAFNDVLLQKPDDYEAAFMKGQAQSAAGDYAGAKASLEQALKIQPALVDAKGRLGWVEKKLGNADAAAKIRADLVALKEKSPANAATIDGAIKLIDSAK